jgi:CzcA family heavy metal efflux pump
MPERSSMRDGQPAPRSPIRVLLSQWRALYALVAVLCIWGLVAVRQLPQQVFPTLTFSRVLVVAENGDLAPSLVQSSIAKPIEEQLASAPGVKLITANSTQGAAAISVTFDPNVADANLALQRVSAIVAATQGNVPKDTHISTQRIDASLFPVLGYGLVSKHRDQMALREFAQYTVRPQLLGLPGVAAGNVLAGAVREYLISVDPRRLAAHGITVEQLCSAISATNTTISVGHSDNHFVRSTLLASGQAHSADDIARITVTTQGGTPVSVGSLAAVVETPAPPTWAGSIDGTPGVMLSVFAQNGANFVAVASEVQSAIDALAASNPDVEFTRFWNQGRLVQASISSLQEAILIGLALSTLVLFFFLRNWSSTLVAALVIPLTIAMTFGFMAIFGEGLNLMTLGGLAIGVGLVIDDAIVVVENVFRRVAGGCSDRETIASAIEEIAVPMISSTVTTIVVFAPLSLLSGVTGVFFRALATTLTIALLMSLVLALIFTPNVVMQFLRVKRERHNPIVEWTQRRYEPLLRWSLERRTLVIAASLAAFAVTIFVATRLSTDFLPALDEGSFELTYMLPPGTTLAETERVASVLEGVVRQDPAVEHEAKLVALTFQNADIPSGVNSGKIQVSLKPRSSRAPIVAVMRRIEAHIHDVAPNVRASSTQLLADMLNGLSDAPAPVEVRVFGPDQTTLVSNASDIANRISSVPGIAGAFSGAIFHNPNIVIRANPEAGTFSVTQEQLNAAAAVAFGGDIVSTVIASPLSIPVRVRYNTPLGLSLEAVLETPIVTSNTGVQPLSRVATVQSGPPQSEINEYNGRQYLAVTAQLSGASLGGVVAAIKERLRGLTLPAGYTYEIAGAYELQQESFGQFAVALLLSLALVFLVLLVHFRAFRAPLAIVATVPLAAFGAVVALLLTQTTLNVASLMGIILLVGLVAKNGITLLEFAKRREAQGADVIESLLYAGTRRFRPIVMTTLTALLGMVPIAFAFGSGSELLQPLAIAVIGGLAFSTIFTLVVIPVIYATLKTTRPRPKKAAVLEPNSQEAAHV